MTKYMTSWELAIDLNYVSSQILGYVCVNRAPVIYFYEIFNLIQLTVILLMKIIEKNNRKNSSILLFWAKVSGFI